MVQAWGPPSLSFTFYGWKFFGGNGPIFINKKGRCTVINKNKHSHSPWCPTLFSTKIQPSRSSPPTYMALPRTLPNGLPKSHARLGRFLLWVPGKLAVDQKLAGTLWESWDFPGFLVISAGRWWWCLDLEDVMMSVLWLEMSAWSGAKSQVDG